MTTSSSDQISALSTTVIDRGAGTAIQQLQARMQTITQVMANVLEEGKDYGRIPGTDKPTLYKPGAEKLMLTFQLASAQPRIDDLSTSDEIRYRLHVPIEGLDGRTLAVGIGEASSNEEKYRWRKPVCDEEFTDTPEHCRREKWFKGKEKPWKGKQIRTSPADVANTILKMAHKRGFIHGTLLATGASSVFNQDLEDFTKEMRDAILEADEKPGDGASKKKEVKRASETNGGTKPAGTTTVNGHGGLVTEPRKVKDVRVFGKEKNNYALTLEGDKTEYTTKDQMLAAELEGFKSTDHLVRVRFKDNEYQGKTYHNILGFAIADAPVPAAPATTQQATGEMSAQDIPFGR